MMLEQALKYLSGELSIIPVLKGEKKPATTWAEYQTRLPTKDEVINWFSSNGTNIGIVCGNVSGGFVCFDFDGLAWMDIANCFVKRFPWINDTVKIGTGSGKIHLWVRCRELPTHVTKLIKNFKNGHIELRANNHYVLAPFSLHPSGQNYRFVDPDAPILEISKTQLDEIIAWFQPPKTDVERHEKKPFDETTEDQRTNSAEYYLRQAVKTARCGNRNDTCFWLICQLRDLGLLEVEARSWVERYVSEVPQDGHPYTAEEALKTIQQAYKREPRKPAMPRGVKEAKDAIFSEETYDALLSHPLTDAGNAESFKTLYQGQFSYVYEKGKWFGFDGVRWKEDDRSVQLSVLEAARVRGLVALLHKNEESKKMAIRWAFSSESFSRIKATLSLAESMLKSNYEEFDREPFLLCCSNGLVDLKTGQLRPSKSGDLLHRSTGVRFDPNAKSPQWINFLWEIFQGDVELINFIQKAVGYTLTGDISEQCLFINYGTGANGKSTFLGIMEELTGEYSITTPSSTLKERRGDDYIPNDVARMAGARFTKCIELKEKTRLNEERIKSLTGGDRITARFLHQEFFDFTPIHKLWIAVNHKPIIKGTDTAIWRRIRLIPFEAYFPPEKQDRHLKEKLQLELSGILNWAIKGCLEWQRNGFESPDKVKDATEEYRKESDLIGRFLDEKTIQAPEEETRAKELYDSYKKWAEDNGEHPISGTAFGRTMGERNFQKFKTQYIIYRGLRLL